MKTISMPGAQIDAPNVILGMMRILDKSDEEIRTLVHTAREVGVTYLDHADIYGGAMHACEKRFGDAVSLNGSEREKYIIQSKAGIVPSGPYFDFSYEHLVKQAEGSLKALGTDYLDVFLLHRPDSLVEPAEVARAFDELHASGKVRSFGVSNHTPQQIELLKRSLNQPIAVNQVQLSLTHAPMIAQGLSMNMQGLDQAISRDAGLLDYCRLNGISLQAWSPLQSGTVEGTFLDSEHYPDLNDSLRWMAEKYDVTPLAVAIAWITRHPAQMQVVLGSTNPDRIRCAAAGSEVPLTRQEWYELFINAGHVVP